MAGYKLTRFSSRCKTRRCGLNHMIDVRAAADQNRTAYTKILRAPGSAPLSLLHSCPGEVRMIPSRGGPAPSIHVFAPRAQLRRGTAHHHGTAHLEVAAAQIGSVAAWPRIETTRHHTQHRRRHWYGGRRRAWPRCRWAAAGPGRASRRRAERSSRRGRRAGRPPPSGTHSGPAHQVRPHGARNTSGTTGNKNPGTSTGPGVRWRRMGDSNPRGLAPNTLSKRAP